MRFPSAVLLAPFTLAFAFGFYGCATRVTTSSPLTQSQLDGAEVGPAPRAAEEAKVRALIAPKLKGGDAVQYRFGDSARGSIIRDGQTLFGWQLHVLINAKNRQGGFVGFEPYIFFFRNGELVAYQDPKAQKSDHWMLVK